MEFDKYQEQTETTNIYSEALRDFLMPIQEAVDECSDFDIRAKALYRLAETHRLLEIAYVLLGYGGEVAELQNKFKKVLRRDKDLNDFRDEAFSEQGDGLYYAAQLAMVLVHNFGDIAQANLDKLADRQERGKLRGDGDNR